MAELVHVPIDLAALVAAESREDCGAIATFLGTTRDHHDGRHVTGLAYEAYEPMALAAMRVLERAAHERFAIAACRIVHRLGEVPPREASVAVVVTAAHRGPAFDACRWVMDELKRTMPIWKKERYADGGEGWAAGTKLGPGA